MKKNSVLILGASSDIAKSSAYKFATNGYDLLLAARKPEELKIVNELPTLPNGKINRKYYS